jgi:hypothetical protein
VPTTARVSTDLYAVLGVDASVGGDDLARAYRVRAKQLHPDTNADPDAIRQFHELVDAYGVLSNHRTRREYDRARAVAPKVAVAGVRPDPVAPGASPVAPKGWSHRRAVIALVAGALVALLGVGAAALTWQLHAHDADLHARFRPVTAIRIGDADVTFRTPDGRVFRTHEPEQHGEGTNLGPTVRIRYDPANPTNVIVDSNSIGRDITLAIVALKFMIGGVVFVVLGARRLRALARQAPAASATGAR